MIQASQSPRHSLMFHRSSRIQLSAGRISWREAGNPQHPVLIFLHGSWYDSSQWQGIMEPLSDYFHCFALDLLGFGNSPATKPTALSIATEVDCLAEFLTALKLRSVYLIGHSLGAWIAMSYTLKYPEQVKGVISISPEGFSIAHWQKYSWPTKLLLSQPLFLGLWLVGVRSLVSISDGAAPLERSQDYWQLFKKSPATCKLFFQRSTKVIKRELIADQLAGFNRPLLILQNDRDQPSVIAQSEAYARSISGSEYRLLEDLAPVSVDSALPQTAIEIQGFINRIQSKIAKKP
jgi:pimeloyl-ACP methyl ester carboxylesterase